MTHIDEQGHELRLVDVIFRELTEVHTPVEQLLCYLRQIVDLRHRHHGIAAQVRVHHDGLRVGVADHAQSLIARERIEFVLKLRTEIVALEIVDLTRKTLLLVEHHHTRTLRAEV